VDKQERVLELIAEQERSVKERKAAALLAEQAAELEAEKQREAEIADQARRSEEAEA